MSTKLSVSQHAIDEAVKDFRIPRQTADEWIRSNYKKAQFIANIVSKDGKPSRLFAYQRIAFVLADTDDYVLTVYPQNTPDMRMHTKVVSLALRELRKVERKERVTERRVRVEKARLNVDVAACKLRMELTPSKAVVDRNNAEIKRLNERMAALDAELFAVKREKAAMAKAVVAYL